MIGKLYKYNWQIVVLPLIFKNALDNVISAGGGTVNIPACRADNPWKDGDYIAVNTYIKFQLLGAGKDKAVMGYADSDRSTSNIRGGYSKTAINFWRTSL